MTVARARESKRGLRVASLAVDGLSLRRGKKKNAE